MIFKNLPNDFQWETYLELNPDVASFNFYKNEHGAKLHYERFGYIENRQYKHSFIKTNIPLDCVIVINNINNPFHTIKKMVIEKYKEDENYNDYLVVLGYNETFFNIDNLKKLYPTKKIVIYQLEQLFNNQSDWYNEKSNKGFVLDRTRHIKNTLKKCDEIWDYDLDNIDFLKKEGFENIVFKPMVYCDELKVINNIKNPQYDILFYGSINEKRAKYLELLTDKFNICIVTDDGSKSIYKNRSFSKCFKPQAFGNSIYKYIFDSKIILNLHYYDSAIQEQVRLFELIINDKLIVSEKSRRNYYKNLIIEFDDENDMIDKINTGLKKWNKTKISNKFKKLF